MADINKKDKNLADDHYIDIPLTPDDIEALKAQTLTVPLNVSGIKCMVNNSSFSENEQRQSWTMLLTQYAEEYRRSQTEDTLYMKDLTGEAIPNSGACKKSMDFLIMAIDRCTNYDSDYTCNLFAKAYNELEYVLTTEQKDKLMYVASRHAKTQICKLLITRGVPFIPKRFAPIEFRSEMDRFLWQQIDDDLVELKALNNSMKYQGIKSYLK